jgi:hypothetical protein
MPLEATTYLKCYTSCRQQYQNGGCQNSWDESDASASIFIGTEIMRGNMKNLTETVLSWKNNAAAPRNPYLANFNL